jgi:hypothetical protein
VTIAASSVGIRSGRGFLTIRPGSQYAVSIVTLHSTKLTHQGGDEEGHVEIEAGGNIGLVRDILARGRTTPGPYGQAYGGDVRSTPGATGVVVIPSRIDASCTGGCGSDGPVRSPRVATPI